MQNPAKGMPAPSCKNSEVKAKVVIVSMQHATDAVESFNLGFETDLHNIVCM